MDQTVRNKLRNTVTQCRKLLEDATAQTLQGHFGIFPGRKKGEVQIEDESRMAHLTEEDRACRQDLIDHLEHIRAIGHKPDEALEQLVREISFTHLNRFCAYKMMEARGLIREAVSRGVKSQGFFFYLADHPEDERLHNSGRQELAYRHFLDWLGGTLSEEVGVLFNPNDPANRIYPLQRVMEEVLTLINDAELKDIWSLDETIGWVYQYFTPKELRDKARKESQAPRNSYELAFRNQFFTPRYVVEFLTDNALARIWYEMRKGATVLKDRCKYLVRRPIEIFLTESEQPPAEPKHTRDELSQEDLVKQPVYIPHRSKKDPRELKVLDPACGSGHFLLYCFDLFQVIYEEAYDDPDLGTALRKDYPAIDDLRRAVPGLILKYNLHGIDIDLRATQIAALALWLRCQRTYQELGLKNGERPKITRSNIVCAEPMPGETDLLKEFTATLQPKVLGQLVDTVFEKMKFVGESGSLLKIEEEIREAVGKAKFEFLEWKIHQDKAKSSLFPELVKRDQPSVFDFTDMTNEVFLDRAEDEIVAALRQYAEMASNGRSFRRRLFTEDTARGFAFIDLCRKRYDVVLMNPPFGSLPKKPDLDACLPAASAGNLYGAFFIRTAQMLCDGGSVGCITDRTFLLLPTYQEYRDSLRRMGLRALADLGWEVLDGAQVATAAYVVHSYSIPDAWFVDTRDANDKESVVQRACVSGEGAVVIPSDVFETIPTHPIAHWAPPFLRNAFQIHRSFEPTFGIVRKGISPGDSDRFVNVWWEVPQLEYGLGRRWAPYANGGPFSPYYRASKEVVEWGTGGAAIRSYTFSDGRPRYVIRSAELYGSSGLTFGKRGEILNVQILPAGQVFSNEGYLILPLGTRRNKWIFLAFFNSVIARYLVNMVCGLHKEVGAIKVAPIAEELLLNVGTELVSKSETIHDACRALANEETNPEFVPMAFGESPTLAGLFEVCSTQLRILRSVIVECEEAINNEIATCFRIEKSELKRMYCEQSTLAKSVELGAAADAVDLVNSTASWLIGIAFGRWDVRIVLDHALAPKLPDPFDALPTCPPGMLVGPDGLPARPDAIVSEEWLHARPDVNALPPDDSVRKPIISNSDYPIPISWDGILVDDPGHENDSIRRVQGVLEAIWKDRADSIEREACEILDVQELRDYFRKPGNGGFWSDHVKRYSKSRRKAPIYWYLRSAKGNYGLWLYYHRLDKDILFKALLNYVEPKIRLEEDRLKALRSQKETAGSSGREAKQVEKDIDRQEQFLSELHDFGDKLRRAADLNLIPDLNDGVVLNIAPLWELVPWKEAQDYWQELIEGKYEWSSIGKQLREKGLVRK